MASIAMLWFGNPMGRLQRLSVNSFLHFGHKVEIYCYGDTEVVAAPKGVRFRDANEILPESRVFKSRNSYAAFSDIFRYNLLRSQPVVWSDADNICLREDWNFREYVFAYQEPFKLTNNILAIPSDSELIIRLTEEAKFDPSGAYDQLGPVLLSRLVHDFGLLEYAYPAATFNPIHWSETRIIFDPEKRDYILEICKLSHSVSLSNQALKAKGVDGEHFPDGSTLRYWETKFSNRH